MLRLPREFMAQLEEHGRPFRCALECPGQVVRIVATDAGDGEHRFRHGHQAVPEFALRGCVELAFLQFQRDALLPIEHDAHAAPFLALSRSRLATYASSALRLTIRRRPALKVVS